MAAFPDMGPPYAPSRPVARTSSSPDPGIVEDQLVAGMTALQSHDGDCKRAYLPSHWSGCLGAPPGTDEFEHYALHSSPALSSLSCPESSAKSSPRSWDSPEQLGPTPWEAATEQLQNRYHGLDPQLSGVSYVATSHSTEVPTSYPTDAAPFVPTQDFHHPETGSQHVRSQTEPYPAGYRAPPRDGYPTPPESGPPLSTCTAAGDSPSPTDEQRSSQGSKQQPDPNAGRTSVPSGGADDSDKDESYAQLIYRAFMSHPRRAMTLQEIYQWFRENTDKGKDDSKGWQNSVRHNLSMNGVRPALRFTGRQLSANRGSSRPLPDATADPATPRTATLRAATATVVAKTARSPPSGTLSHGPAPRACRARPGIAASPTSAAAQPATASPPASTGATRRIATATHPRAARAPPTTTTAAACSPLAASCAPARARAWPRHCAATRTPSTSPRPPPTTPSRPTPSPPPRAQHSSTQTPPPRSTTRPPPPPPPQ
ncbi:uncharacterized protein THITE_2120613 [Thermothielavioides terrestris NRRL 8126]|uniref:Fork-head domain-containing protein n=1 Tax=Thermothielavioides terrestris (strain ATCC 38088 / NRRL 8126) TaxID=578455 RepID=G2RCX3_THETT|nr:uncharacterized protein THITE_2120613 [Thermothielavioides terrestris NRRL 8126]AEO69861.1 hypothetical protein THITE_2120613 [Thermothielavioides terrestris NRRL 8126]